MNMEIKRLYIVIIIAVLIAGAAGMYFLTFRKTVETGDTVWVNYTGYLDTGEVFDTTFEEVAMDDSEPKVWWFKIKASYEPIKIVVGSGQMLPDFEMALIGMREGQKKEITIPPEKVAGYRDPDKIKEVPLARTLQKEEKIGIEKFKDNFKRNPVEGEYYQFQGLSVKVLEIKEDTVRLAYDLKQGQEIYISLGRGTVTEVTETEYKITLTPKVGDTIYLPYGMGIIIEVREDAMLVDFNPVLAGETLHYTIWVVEIEKAD
ncbi:MAG: FKBP-type peptidyl-prolyl cis-trans isomerase [Candidatus Methanofastidiosia archaeon]|jgi:peptidylprolyl isomerase